MNNLLYVNTHSTLTRHFTKEQASTEPPVPLLDFHAHIRPSNVGYMPAADPALMVGWRDG